MSVANEARTGAGEAIDPARPPHLAVRGLGRQFGTGDWAVRDSDFEVRKGEFFGFLGPSGCGKSTTLNLIAGFLEPTQGEIMLAGRRLNAVPAHRRGTAMVFQDYALFPHLSAADNVAFGMKLRRRPGKVVATRVAELLELVGLSHRAANLPAQLSGGEQQRVALARALAVDPEVVLLDEPLSNLDARMRLQMRRELRRILGAAGVTVLFVTHDQSEAFSLCDRVAVMLAGRIQDQGTPDRLYSVPATEAVAKFVGEGNFLVATVARREAATMELRIELGGRQTRADAVQHPASPNARGTLLVRPESLRLTPADGGSQIRGRVKKVEFQGAITQYQVEVGAQTLISYGLSNGTRHRTGDEVGVAWKADEAVFFPSTEDGGAEGAGR